MVTAAEAAENLRKAQEALTAARNAEVRPETAREAFAKVNGKESIALTGTVQTISPSTTRVDYNAAFRSDTGARGTDRSYFSTDIPAGGVTIAVGQEDRIVFDAAAISNNRTIRMEQNGNGKIALAVPAGAEFDVQYDARTQTATMTIQQGGQTKTIRVEGVNSPDALEVGVLDRSTNTLSQFATVGQIKNQQAVDDRAAAAAKQAKVDAAQASVTTAQTTVNDLATAERETAEREAAERARVEAIDTETALANIPHGRVFEQGHPHGMGNVSKITGELELQGDTSKNFMVVEENGVNIVVTGEVKDGKFVVSNAYEYTDYGLMQSSDSKYKAGSTLAVNGENVRMDSFREAPLTREQANDMQINAINNYRSKTGWPPLTDQQKTDLRTSNEAVSPERITEVGRQWDAAAVQAERYKTAFNAKATAEGKDPAREWEAAKNTNGSDVNKIVNGNMTVEQLTAAATQMEAAARTAGRGTAPSGTAPTAPSGTAPTAPSGTAPTAPSGTAPTAPSGTAPANPGGSRPVTAQEAKDAMKRIADRVAPLNGGVVPDALRPEIQQDLTLLRNYATQIRGDQAKTREVFDSVKDLPVAVKENITRSLESSGLVPRQPGRDVGSLIEMLISYITGRPMETGVAPSGTAPTAPSGTAPTAPSGTAPTAPSGTAPTAPSGTAPTAPSGTAPTAPSGTAPTAPSGTRPTAPSGTAPTAPSGTAPTAPSGTAPTAPSGTAPTAPSGTRPTAPSGTAPTAPSGAAPSAPAPVDPRDARIAELERQNLMAFAGGENKFKALKAAFDREAQLSGKTPERIAQDWRGVEGRLRAEGASFAETHTNNLNAKSDSIAALKTQFDREAQLRGTAPDQAAAQWRTIQQGMNGPNGDTFLTQKINEINGHVNQLQKLKTSFDNYHDQLATPQAERNRDWAGALARYNSEGSSFVDAHTTNLNRMKAAQGVLKPAVEANLRAQGIPENQIAERTRQSLRSMEGTINEWWDPNQGVNGWPKAHAANLNKETEAYKNLMAQIDAYGVATGMTPQQVAAQKAKYQTEEFNGLSGNHTQGKVDALNGQAAVWAESNRLVGQYWKNFKYTAEKAGLNAVEEWNRRKDIPGSDVQKLVEGNLQNNEIQAAYNRITAQTVGDFRNETQMLQQRAELQQAQNNAAKLAEQNAELQRQLAARPVTPTGAPTAGGTTFTMEQGGRQVPVSVTMDAGKRIAKDAEGRLLAAGTVVTASIPMSGSTTPMSLRFEVKENGVMVAAPNAGPVATAAPTGPTR